MQARYRTDYPGEFVITETRWEGGKRTETREWIPNPIENHHISGRAVCIGNLYAKQEFDYTRLQRHRGGLLSSKKLQTYGTGDIAQEMRLDFAVDTRNTVLETLAESKYDENNVVYTTARNCIAYPGRFYLIPHAPRLHDFIQLAYLAAFDGHQEIFLLGYSRDNPFDTANWITQLCDVIRSYSGVKFFLVGEPTNNHQEILECANVETLSYKQWYSYCDV
jgi:hypothetical protein